MPRSRSLVLLAAAALAAALAPAALATAVAPTAADRADERARAEHARVVAYWTPQRMAAAIPRDFVRQPDGTFLQAPTPRGSLDAATGTSTGASWTGGGAVLAQTGKVYFVMGRTGYVCSGAVAQDGGADGNAVILTAGHCVYDGARYSRKYPAAGFATNWLFIPDFDTNPNLNTTNCAAAATTYGCWTARALYVHRGFATQRSFTSTATRYDFGFAVVGRGGRDGTADLDVAVGGAYPVDVTAGSSLAAGSVLSAFGYPAAAPYGGKDLTYCRGPISPDANNANATWGMSCDMTGGSSGGPWLAGIGTTGVGGALSSLNSYGYSGVATMYGPKFNADTRTVYDAALSGARSTPISAVVG